MNQSVSVIIPTYNGIKYIKQAIDSAIAQTLPALEIIVVDDGSTDGTEEIILSYGNQVKYIPQKNKRTAGAYNTGVFAAKGKYIAFLEHDDVWSPEKNSEQVKFLENNKEFGMVYSTVELLFEGTASKQADIHFQDTEGEYNFADFFTRNRVLNCSSVMLRKEVLDNIGGFREDLALAFDYDLWLRIANKYKIFCQEALYTQYRIHSNNLSKDDDELKAAEGSLATILYWKNNAVAQQRVGIKLFRDRLAKLHKRVAWDYSLIDQRDKELSHLWQAVKNQPLDLNHWKLFFWHSLNRKLRSRLTWYTRKF